MEERGRAWTFLELVRICCGGFAEDRAEDKILCLALSSSLSTVPISRLLSSSLQFDQTKKVTGKIWIKNAQVPLSAYGGSSNNLKDIKDQPPCQAVSPPAPVLACPAECVLCCSCVRAALLPRATGHEGDHPRVGAGVHECSRLRGKTKNSHQAASPLFTHTHCQPFNHQSPVSKRSWPGGKIKISCRPRDLARLHHLPSRLTKLDSLLSYVDIFQHNILTVHFAFSPQPPVHLGFWTLHFSDVCNPHNLARMHPLPSPVFLGWSYSFAPESTLLDSHEF